MRLDRPDAGTLEMDGESAWPDNGGRGHAHCFKAEHATGTR
jgi:hypothetical protein